TFRRRHGKDRRSGRNGPASRFLSARLRRRHKQTEAVRPGNAGGRSPGRPLHPVRGASVSFAGFSPHPEGAQGGTPGMLSGTGEKGAIRPFPLLGDDPDAGPRQAIRLLRRGKPRTSPLPPRGDAAPFRGKGMGPGGRRPLSPRLGKNLRRNAEESLSQVVALGLNPREGNFYAAFLSPSLSRESLLAQR